MARRFTCYKLSYEAPGGKAMQYWGTTQVRSGQSQADACSTRLNLWAASNAYMMWGPS